MRSAEQILREIIDDLFESLTIGRHGRDTAELARRLTLTEIQLIDAFAWLPIARAAEFGLTLPPKGHNWGPLVSVMIQGENVKKPVPAIGYYDPSTTAPGGPLWRVCGQSRLWSIRNQPTHFIRPYGPHNEQQDR